MPTLPASAISPASESCTLRSGHDHGLPSLATNHGLATMAQVNPPSYRYALSRTLCLYLSLSR